ncbi:MAG: HIT domain-containing protein [Chloroflexi bacterium]|nr:MAG: HIT domain-containing protein [Chloroflexota bacterium]
MKLKPILFKIARSRFAEYFIGFAFAYLTRFMPLDRLWESKRVVVFKHPVPSWQTHWLGVPKKRVRSFAALDFEDEETQALILEVYEGLVKTAVSHNLPSFSILVNGGSYQDVPQIHFHLIDGPTISGQNWEPEKHIPPASSTEIVQNDSAIAYSHPSSTSDFHFIVTSQQSHPFGKNDFAQAKTGKEITAVFQLAQNLITQHNPPGYRIQINLIKNETTPLTFHLVT